MAAMAGIDGDTLDRHFLTLTPPFTKTPDPAGPACSGQNSTGRRSA